MSTGALVAATALLVGLGCPASEPELEPAPDCGDVEPGDPTLLPARTVEIGTLADDAFVVWTDGEILALIFGFQGAAMITPYLEVPAQDEDGERSCWLVTLEYEDAEGQRDRSFRDALEFWRVGEVMRTGPVFGPIEADFWGDPAHLSVEVTSETFSARRELDVEFASP